MISKVSFSSIYRVQINNPTQGRFFTTEQAEGLFVRDMFKLDKSDISVFQHPMEGLSLNRDWLVFTNDGNGNHKQQFDDSQQLGIPVSRFIKNKSIIDRELNISYEGVGTWA